MKTLLTAFLLFILAPFASSQVWIDTGAVWHYDWDNLWGGLGFQRTEYVDDEMVDGKNCQKLITYHYQYSWFGVPDSSTTLLETNYTYVNGDTVFYYDHGEFFVLYDFGAIPGDSWIISTTNDIGECDDTSRMVVTDTGHMEIASVSYRYIDVAPTSNSSIGQIGRIVERFGNIGGPAFQPHQYLFPSHFDCDSMAGVVEWAYPSFKCFQDESFSLYNPSGEDCEYLATYYGIEDPTQLSLEIFPNPTSDYLHLEPGSMFENWLIVESSGKVLLNGETAKTGLKIDVSSLQSGTYVLVLTGQHGSTYSRFVKN